MRLTSFQQPSPVPSRNPLRSPQPHPLRTRSSAWRLATLIVLALGLSHDPTNLLAQVTTAIIPTQGTGDLGTTVTPTGHTIQITGGTRPGNGTNLFHSFEHFNLAHSDIAQFLNTTPSLRTDTILSRVTGGDPSSLFGTIDTMSYPGANFFFMNPAGIVFGPAAALNVAGSVAFTTADYLKLADTQVFHAAPNMTADALLSSAPVAAYGFLRSTPGSIIVQGSQFTVFEGNSLSLVGGDITIQSGTTAEGVIQPARLTAPGGQITLVSAMSSGAVTATTLNDAPNIHGQFLSERGAIQISQHSTIATSGDGGGTIRIRGGHFLLDSSTMSANTMTAGIGSTTGPLGNGIDIRVTHDALIQNSAIETNVIGPVAPSHGSGGIHISAHDITIAGGPAIFDMIESDPTGPLPFSGLRSNIEPDSTAGHSGNITLEAQTIHLQDLGQIQTQTTGTGHAGHISLQAVGNIDFANLAILSSISENSSGHAGKIDVSSRQGNVLLRSSFITTQTDNSSGNTGTITLMAPHGTIALTDGSSILNAAYGTGMLRGIHIGANNLILQGESRIDGDNSSTQVAENISITLGDRLTLTEQSAIETATSGTTDAANVTINASHVVITQESRLHTGTTGSGAGGSITMKATDQITMSNGAAVTASSTGTGDAGTISINTGRELNLYESSITTQAVRANGGNIDIRAIDRVRLVNSQISTSVKGVEGSGGNIFIDPKVVVLQNSNVIAQAVGGSGGNITFVTPLFLADASSLVSASSAHGPQGTVTIQSPISNLSETVGQLVSRIHLAEALYQNRCVAKAHGGQSTFILARRDALANDPGGWLRSPVLMTAESGTEVGTVPNFMTRNLGPDESPMATAQVPNTQMLSLRRLTPPNFLVQSFAMNGSSGCGS